jgi:hypothetical protein
MNIYLVSREDKGGPDQLMSLVVIAPDASSARNLAARRHGDEGFNFWYTPHAVVQQLGVALADYTQSGVVCQDFPTG